jgi:hypothetical protein
MKKRHGKPMLLMKRHFEWAPRDDCDEDAEHLCHLYSRCAALTLVIVPKGDTWAHRWLPGQCCGIPVARLIVQYREQATADAGLRFCCWCDVCELSRAANVYNMLPKTHDLFCGRSHAPGRVFGHFRPAGCAIILSSMNDRELRHGIKLKQRLLENRYPVYKKKKQKTLNSSGPLQLQLHCFISKQ